MKLLIQPEDGVRALLRAIAGAKHHVEIVIFRFDQREVEAALANAVSRGVAVHALIAHTNRSGEDGLRRLEQRLLASGVTVARTADELVRYHGKFMIVDRRELYLLAFNLTYLDIERSRSFGLITRRPEIVREAGDVFQADVLRHSYESNADDLIVSPVNARHELARFLRGAKRELWIYDPKVSDPEMLSILEKRAAAGVDIRLIGRITKKIPGVSACKLGGMRLHTRTMIRDGRVAFLGSQSLRSIELDARREVGLVFRDRKAIARIRETFLADWKDSEDAAKRAIDEAPAVKVARKVAKVLAKDLPPVAPLLNGFVKEMVGDTHVLFDPEEIESVVKGAVKEAVKEVVSDAIEEAVEVRK